MLRLIDWSPNNPNPDWLAEKGRGLDGALLKASEGTYGWYPVTRTHWDTLARLDLIRGLYDFGMPDLDNPVAEANFFLQTCQREGITFAPHDTIWLDFERIGRLGAASPADWAFIWLKTVGDAIGAAPGFPGVYCTYDYVAHVLNDPRLAQYELWLAAWSAGSNVDNSTPPAPGQAPALPAGSVFKDYSVWQWSASSRYFSTAVIPGAGVDEDLSYLTRDAFRAKYGKRDPHPAQQYKMVNDGQWLRAKPEAQSNRLINAPPGTIVTNYGAPTPSWLWVTYQGVHGYVLRTNCVPA